jgi:hypothetical protein
VVLRGKDWYMLFATSHRRIVNPHFFPQTAACDAASNFYLPPCLPACLPVPYTLAASCPLALPRVQYANCQGTIGQAREKDAAADTLCEP